MMRPVFFFCFVILGCAESESKYERISAHEINAILGEFGDTDAVFTSKGVSFDSIVTYAGKRMLNGTIEKTKLKLFFYGEYCRGYFNLPEKDTKNLQVFGKKISGDWILKCVTKLNMEEAGGYIFLVKEENAYNGIWSNGHVNFKKGNLRLQKQKLDYNILTDW